MYIDWDTVWTNIISGLFVGGIIGFAGFIIWKRQHLYSKKLDAYTSIVTSLNSYIIYLRLLFLSKSNSLEKANLKNLVIELDIAFSEKRTIFCFYFGDKYKQSLFDLLELSNKIKMDISK